MKEVIVYDNNGHAVSKEPLGADGDNVGVNYGGAQTDASSAIEDIVEQLDGIAEGVEKTSGVVVDGVGSLSIDMGNIKAGVDIDGIPLDELLQSAFGLNNTFSLLHLSDSHGGTACINALISMAKADNSIGMILHTGDFGNNAYNAMLDADCIQPVLAILGNHDAWDTYSHDHADATAAIAALNGDDVVFGDEQNSYWYKDVTTPAGKTIRFIALNEYDYSNDAAVAWIYTVCYTQSQMEWFLDLLHDTPNSYYIVLVTHQPVQSLAPSPGDWICGGASNTYYEGGDASWLPKIIEAYKNHTAFSGTYTHYARPELDFSVAKDFSDLTENATFICYLSGHTHFDWCSNLDAYPEQLMLDVTRADSNASAGTNAQGNPQDDVARTPISYAANKVTIDLGLRKVIVERIGSTILTGGGERTKIVFDF